MIYFFPPSLLSNSKLFKVDENLPSGSFSVRTSVLEVFSFLRLGFFFLLHLGDEVKAIT